ncbi:MAG: histone deacetylase family protein [bacterium]|nr:histone deacetylase family protein [bacterium]
MLQIERLADRHNNHNRELVEAVLRLYQEAFPYYPKYASRIAQLIETPIEADFESVLLVAKGSKNRLLGFVLFFYFRDLNFAYLDYLATSKSRIGRGIGAALYESAQQWLKGIGCQGLLMDVPTDDPKRLLDPKELKTNQKRLAFYEQYGARPLTNTGYETIVTRANKGFFTLLVYDALSKKAKGPQKAEVAQAITRIHRIKGDMGPDDPALLEILASLKDDPLALRPLKYAVAPKAPKVNARPIELINIGDGHQIHHLKEKGYVEKPARIEALKEGLKGLNLIERKIQNFPIEALYAVHSRGMVQYLEQAGKRLTPKELLYPTVFPLRRADRIPKTWDMRAGYYCIDTFTPLTANVFKAAQRAAYGALSGAKLIEEGSELVYVMCRPPGHHAQKNAYGGFCYFNNASLAANRLSARGKVAFIDLDYHHGNGSQDIFYQRSDVLFLSIHGHPSQAYPYFAGFADEKGEGEGVGYNVNYPLYPGIKDEEYLQTLQKAIRRIRKSNAQYLVVSLGLDIMTGDPTGSFFITKEGMFEIGKTLKSLGLPTLVVQEGGYSLKNLRTGLRHFFVGIS